MGWLRALLAFIWEIVALRLVDARWLRMSSGGRLELGAMVGCRGVRVTAQKHRDGWSKIKIKIKSFRACRRELLLSWQK
ncbi:hypothetical protein [Xanthomonas sp. 1678]|uniref:hypothetical protein n=1 Tax=Xanthomonas sp. 1678 TaxID=3158788 RepID=UPI00285C657B|nr:hypothetical protein [Xanthomonas translucens]